MSETIGTISAESAIERHQIEAAIEGHRDVYLEAMPDHLDLYEYILETYSRKPNPEIESARARGLRQALDQFGHWPEGHRELIAVPPELLRLEGLAAELPENEPLGNHLQTEWKPLGHREVAMRLREDIFQKGQGIPREIDEDGKDNLSHHYVGYVFGEPVAVARLRRDPGDPASVHRLERFGVLKEYRGERVGAALMQHILRSQKLQGSDLRLEAQIEAPPGEGVIPAAWYEQFGFVHSGNPYVHEGSGIKHVPMKLEKSGLDRVVARLRT